MITLNTCRVGTISGEDVASRKKSLVGCDLFQKKDLGKSCRADETSRKGPSSLEWSWRPYRWSVIGRGKLAKHVAKLCVKDLALITYRRPHVWVLSKARRYKTPFVYSHPHGAIKWVQL